MRRWLTKLWRRLRPCDCPTCRANRWGLDGCTVMALRSGGIVLTMTAGGSGVVGVTLSPGQGRTLARSLAVAAEVIEQIQAAGRN